MRCEIVQFHTALNEERQRQRPTCAGLAKQICARVGDYLCTACIADIAVSCVDVLRRPGG